MPEPGAEGAGGAAAVENKEQYVPWSRFTGVMNENKELKGSVDDLKGQVQTLTEQVTGLQPAGGNGRGDGAAKDIYGDPDGYVNDRVKAGVDEALAARDTEGRDKQRKMNESAAMEYLQGQPEWKADPQAADKDFTEVMREMRTNPEVYAEAAVLMYRHLMKDDETPAEGKDKSGNRRVAKEAVASLKGKSSGNGGFSRSQIRGMSADEFTKNKDAILKAGQEGNISDD